MAQEQQSAVEWLARKIYFEGLDDEFVKQAKEIEKKQIIDAILNNQNGLLRRKTIIEAEQYYNETYNP